MAGEHLRLDALRVHAQSRKVVMAVAFGVRNSEIRRHREVLDHGNRPHAAEVFAAQDERTTWIALTKVSKETGVHDPAKDPFAVLVTAARVAAIQGVGKAVQLAIGLIDNQRGAVMPALEVRLHGLPERNVAMERLLPRKSARSRNERSEGSD